MERQYGNHIDSRKVCIIRGALEHHDKHSNTNGINFQIILVSFHKFVVLPCEKGFDNPTFSLYKLRHKRVSHI
jgi:hypothetical protein